MGHKKLQEKILLRGHHKLLQNIVPAPCMYISISNLCIKTRNTGNQRVHAYQLLNKKPRNGNIAHIYRADTTKNKRNPNNDFYPFTH